MAIITYSDQLYKSLVELIQLPSTSGHEEHVRDYLERQLQTLGFSTRTDSTGNLVATLDGTGTALLLNAHMDRVAPGLGHTPVLRDGVLYSDGATNLGADDAAGIAIILEVVRRLNEQQLPHPPLVLVFTVQEETGLCGSNSRDLAHFLAHLNFQVQDGIVFDNAFEAGVVVSAGAAYKGFTVDIKGRSGHPGKDLTHTVNAIEIFHASPYPHGSLHNDQTRINLGLINGGYARNAVADTVHIEGELRSFEPPEVIEHYCHALRNAFAQTATRMGGTATITFSTHAEGYQIRLDEPLVQTYQAVLEQRNAQLHTRPTFIGSDTSGFRRNNIRVFTLSTGVFNEHTKEEYVALAPLEQIVQDMLQVLHRWQISSSSAGTK
jgi:tripeptide aminopeptidase